LCVKVVPREQRVSFHVALEIPPYVPPVLTHKRPGLVLRMALEEYQQPRILLHEGIDVTVAGASEHLVSFRGQLVRGDAIPARVRKAQACGRAGEQWVRRSLPAGEDPEVLVLTAHALNAVERQ